MWLSEGYGEASINKEATWTTRELLRQGKGGGEVQLHSRRLSNDSVVKPVHR